MNTPAKSPSKPATPAPHQKPATPAERRGLDPLPHVAPSTTNKPGVPPSNVPAKQDKRDAAAPSPGQQGVTQRTPQQNVEDGRTPQAPHVNKPEEHPASDFVMPADRAAYEGKRP